MLKWVFGADTGPFRSALSSMRGQTQAFSGSVKGQLAGIFGGAALFAGVSAIIEKFARLKDIADRFGESAESMQRVGYAAAQSGTDIEGVAKGLTKVTANAVKAAQNGGELAESFSRLGIDAATFANLPIEDKLLALSAGYDASKSSGEGLNDIIAVMGKSGAEMIPMLVQGTGRLKEQMDSAKVAGEGVVAVLAGLDDRIEEFKNGFAVVFATIIAGFTAVTATVGLLAAGWLDAIAGGFDMSEVRKAEGAIAQLWKDIFDPEKETKVKGPDVEAIKAAAEAAKKAEEDRVKLTEDRVKLTEDIAKLEEDARIKALSLAEQILDVQKRISELAKESTYGTDETKKLEAKKAMLEAEKELTEYQKQAASDAEEANDKRDKLATDLDAAHDREDKQNRDNKYSGLDDKGKLAMLKKERDEARKDAENLGQRGFHVEATDKRTEAAAKQGEIDTMTRKIDAKKNAPPKLLTEEIRKAGGGGFGGLTAVQTSSTDGRLDKVIAVLNNIDRKTNPTEGVGPEPF